MTPEAPLQIPKPARIVEIVEMTAIEKLFRLEFVDGSRMGFRPGQFVEVSVPGVGEAPISICKSPTRPGPLEITVRRVGRVTKALHAMKAGDVIGLRGPFGNGFPMEKMKGHDILLVAGGLGMAPLNSVLQYVLDRREDYGRIILMYGIRTYRDALFREEVFRMLEAQGEPVVLISYERDDPFMEEIAARYPNNVRKGVITVLCKECLLPHLTPGRTSAVVCGPPIMYKFVLKELVGLGIPPERIYMTLERRMECGMGKCGHCIVGGASNIKYICRDGPVFTGVDALTIRGLI